MPRSWVAVFFQVEGGTLHFTGSQATVLFGLHRDRLCRKMFRNADRAPARIRVAGRPTKTHKLAAVQNMMDALAFALRSEILWRPMPTFIGSESLRAGDDANGRLRPKYVRVSPIGSTCAILYLCKGGRFGAWSPRDWRNGFSRDMASVLPEHDGVS